MGNTYFTMEYTFFNERHMFGQGFHVENSFMVDGWLYSSAEEYMMVNKAKFFGDEEVFESMMETSDPKALKALGRKIKNFDAKKWDAVAENIVYDGNYGKFSQDMELYHTLIETRNTLLVYASSTDLIWGNGLDETDAAMYDYSNWKGKNLLGVILTRLREDLMEDKQNRLY